MRTFLKKIKVLDDYTKHVDFIVKRLEDAPEFFSEAETKEWVALGEKYGTGKYDGKTIKVALEEFKAKVTKRIAKDNNEYYKEKLSGIKKKREIIDRIIAVEKKGKEKYEKLVEKGGSLVREKLNEEIEKIKSLGGSLYDIADEIDQYTMTKRYKILNFFTLGLYGKVVDKKIGKYQQACQDVLDNMLDKEGVDEKGYNEGKELLRKIGELKERLKSNFEKDIEVKPKALSG